MTPTRQTVFATEHPNGWGNCLSATLASILDLPLSEVIDMTDPAVRAAGFWRSVYAWLGDRGLKVFSVGPDDPRLNGVYSIGKGPSPRGNFHHAVVCKSGRMVFDPHPSDDGVLTIEQHDIFVEMTDVEKKLHEIKGRKERP